MIIKADVGFTDVDPCLEGQMLFQKSANFGQYRVDLSESGTPFQEAGTPSSLHQSGSM